MSYRTDKLMIDGHTHIHTHAGNDNTRRSKLASGKKGNKNIYKKKIFSGEILLLTWHVISMLQSPFAEYSYNWYFYSCDFFKFPYFHFHKQMEFNVLKCHYSLANQYIKILYKGFTVNLLLIG